MSEQKENIKKIKGLCRFTFQDPEHFEHPYMLINRAVPLEISRINKLGNWEHFVVYIPVSDLGIFAKGLRKAIKKQRDYMVAHLDEIDAYMNGGDSSAIPYVPAPFKPKE